MIFIILIVVESDMQIVDDFDHINSRRIGYANCPATSSTSYVPSVAKPAVQELTVPVRAPEL